jgi:nucleotide-binding universal stress UspA family protein
MVQLLRAGRLFIRKYYLKEISLLKKILVCLDGSDLAEQTLPYIKEQARSSKSTVVLLRVTPEPVIVPLGVPGEPGYPIQTESMVKEMQQEIIRSKEYLNNLALGFKKLGIRTKCVVLEGLVGESIVNYAKDNRINLIAMATHGRSGVGRMILGSVADFVLRESGLPILIIRPQRGKGAQ